MLINNNLCDINLKYIQCIKLIFKKFIKNFNFQIKNEYVYI